MRSLQTTTNFLIEWTGNKMKNMQEVFDCIFTRPYAEDSYAMNDFIETLIRHLSWKMFEHQEEICYNITEKNPPMLKDNVVEYMRNVLNNEFGWVRNYIICRMLISYRLSNVDLGEEAEWYLREEFDEDSWNDLNDAINRYIWEDYARTLGTEGAKKYFKRIDRSEYIMEENND